ncbi:hypothetical protein [Blastopirellula marina]|uniref:AsmA-like C-terminal domain-containing protein n=1 Tax=Blastopirellula marina TaxID=124 RepID=A0A2S8F298_9BACT|nr:hypothetical protein [Blastopirellula marina]PQO26292.1 hypothetical protein C5Y98_31095 [Blastopirellula marina]PQO47172.1 hypothetical protein C5Y93_03785 [Blastopirellula marina]PTL40692.1 hypothetical protein C5Y97_31110 [Blastopirellula marina]
MTDATPKKRRWRLWLFCACAALILLIAALPTIASYRPLTQSGLSAVLAASEVEVTVDSVSLGWLTPSQIEGLNIRQREDKFNVSVPHMRNDVYFWQLILNPRQLGNLDIVDPNLHFVIQKQEDSLVDAINAEPTPIDQTKLTQALNRQISVNIRNATLSAQRPGGANWQIDHFELSGHLTPANEERGPLLRFDHIQAMDHFKLTEEMCDDLLKYAVPIMHGVTNVNGEASLRFEAWEIPLDNPKRGSGRGTLEIHHASLVSGPVIRSITDALQIAPSVQIADDCHVKFRLENERVYHEGLELGLPNFRIQTSGSVGLDDTLDITCVIPIPIDESIDESMPILFALKGKTLRLHITGTLQEPQVDVADSLAELTQSILGGEAGDIQVDQILGAAAGVLQRMREEGPLIDPQTTEELRPLGGLFNRLRKRLSGDDEEQPPDSSEPPKPPESSNSGTDL